MADAAISSLLQTLEWRYFTDTGHALHPNNQMPHSFYTFNLRMLKFQTGIGRFYAKLLDEGQQSVIIPPEGIAFLQEAHEWIQREYREFEDEIRNSSPNQGEGSAELCTSDMLCPFRRFREWFECLQVLTNHLNFFVVRLNELMNGTEPQSIKMIKIEEKTGNVKVVVPEIRSEEGIVVGIEEEVKKIKHLVIGDTSSRLEIISIVGMGGIGKSTLARVIYHDNKVSQHFDVRTWITVSQIYDARAILLSLLNAGKEEYQQLNDEELRTKVYQCLKYRRYLIIFDDVWNTHVCDDMKRVLPNDDNGSRVVLTTRQTFIADYAGSEIYNVPHMSKDTSWNLLEKKVFRGDNCPLELAEIGTDIAQKCHGLPLTIVVIAGLLQVNRTRAWWENIANDVKSAIYENDEHHVFDILSLSYDHLPGCLQPCLLYFSII